jgi:hypothetical protein
MPTNKEPARAEPGCGLCVHYRVLYALEKHEMEIE